MLKALISLAGQTVCAGFHAKGCDIVSAVCLGLFSDRNDGRAAGPMIWSVQMETGNSEQIIHRVMWIECERKIFACLCPAVPGNSSECVLNSCKSVSFPAGGLP